jgi:glycerol-3-phosphate dehydrogenase
MQTLETFSGNSFTIRARKIVDATGPWEDRGNLRLVRGSHLVLPRVNAGANAIAHFEDSGRIVFIIPWDASGSLSLVGTTDCDHDLGPDNVHITAEEVRYLLRIVRRLFPHAQALEPIAAYSSLRPLLRSRGSSATSSSREHRIWYSQYGVLHIAGGKYTTYRAMSEQACDLLLGEIAPSLVGKCFTASTPLGADPAAGLIASPVARAVYHEMARRLSDLMFVSTYWGYEKKWTPDTLRPIAEEMAGYLAWDRSTIKQEIEHVLDLVSVPEY